MLLTGGSGDPRVLGYLGRALSLELSAVQMYSTQARLAEVWGLSEAAASFSKEAAEELSHAQQIIGRMLALGVAPNASQLRPVSLGQTLEDLLKADQAFELELVEMYKGASSYCAKIGDNDNRVFFEGLLKEEMAHARELEAWLGRLRGPTAGGKI